MENKAENPSKLLIVLIVTFVAIILWLLSIFYAFSEFQNTRLDDPLAEINSLVPLFYIAIALSGLSIVACLFWRMENKYLHLLLLITFAGMLWVTPFLLTSFVRLADSAWHVGSAMGVPEILGGELINFSSYAWDYPASFIYHYSFVKVIGIEPLTYIFFFPLLCMFLFVLLSYALMARLFNARVALLAMLLAITGLHYLQLHASPHTVGALLMLTTLLLLSVRGTMAKIVPVVLILITITVVAHSTTPFLLAIFLASALIIEVVYSRRIGRFQIALAGILIACFAIWFAWFLYYPVSPMVQALGAEGDWKNVESVYQGLTADFEVGSEFLTGTQFAYSNIYSLNKAVYFIYGLLGLLCVIYAAARAYAGKTGIKEWLYGIGGLKYGEAILCLSLIPLFILTFILAGRAHGLIETGLTYIILALSCIVASVIIRYNFMDWKIIRVSLPFLALFLTLSFPVIAYSIDSYSNIPQSEEAGLKFLVEKGSLEGETVFGSNMVQLALYAPPSFYKTRFESFNRKELWYLSETKVDMVVFRNTGYYYAAMRTDRSFENNRFNVYLAETENAGYFRIYSSPTFNVYSVDGMSR